MPINNAELFTYKVTYDFAARPHTGAEHFERFNGYAITRHYTASDAMVRVQQAGRARHPARGINILDVKAVPELQETIDGGGRLELQETGGCCDACFSKPAPARGPTDADQDWRSGPRGRRGWASGSYLWRHPGRDDAVGVQVSERLRVAAYAIGGRPEGTAPARARYLPRGSRPLPSAVFFGAASSMEDRLMPLDDKQEGPAEPSVPEGECCHAAGRQEITADHLLCLDCGALWLSVDQPSALMEFARRRLEKGTD